MNFFPEEGRKKRAQRAGVSVSELNPLKKVAAAMVKANCLYNSPVIPPTNAVGIKTAINTKTTPTTGPVISPIACSTASFDEYFPVSSKRVEFSTTTIASSTTMAIASTKPKRVRVFTENPNKCMTAKVQISDTGMVRDGIITARQFCKNNKITSMTSDAVLDKCYQYLIDRSRHKIGRIENHFISNTRRQILGELFHFRPELASKHSMFHYFEPGDW